MAQSTPGETHAGPPSGADQPAGAHAAPSAGGSARHRRPLDGIRVIDLSNMLMAPYATVLLGDMGADVIKIESPEGDPIRGIGPMRHPGMGGMFLALNRSKRSVVLDLKQPEGCEVLCELIAGADVVVTNIRPRALSRLGLDYERLSATQPALIWASLVGYGEGGPYADRPAFDDLIQGAVGVPWLSHLADGSEPRYCPTALVDRGVALFALAQVNAALFERSRSGLGQKIEIPMFEFMASFVLGDHAQGAHFEPPIGPTGYPRMLNAWRKPFRTSDGWICAMIYTDRHWRSFFRAIGREDAFERDPRYASMTSRTEHIADLYRELGELLATRGSAEWLALFDAADVPAMLLHTPDSLLDDPHLARVDFFSSQVHPSEGMLRTMAYPARWSATQPAASRPAPRLGEHGIEVLREMGIAPARIDLLRRQRTLVVPVD